MRSTHTPNPTPLRAAGLLSLIMNTINHHFGDEFNTHQTQPNIEQQVLLSLNMNTIIHQFDDEFNTHQTQSKIEQQVSLSLSSNKT